MSLSSALDISRSTLSVVGDLAQVTSRNIARSGDASASRKVAALATMLDGGVRIASITRSIDAALRDRVVSASSDNARIGAISDALSALDLTGGETESTASPAARIGSLVAALQTFSASPGDQAAAAGALNAATDLVSTLHDWAAKVATVRTSADSDLRDAVDDINGTLGELANLDSRIVSGTIAGRDITDDLDSRDALVGKIAENVGVSVIRRANNGITLLTDSGLTLYDGQAREVSMGATPLSDGRAGAAVFIDGVAATGSSAVMPVRSGRIAGLIDVRDDIALTAAAQLDEMASGLIRSFAESDQSTSASLPDKAGLFTSDQLTDLPTAGTWVPGLAASIVVNANADPGRGGDVMRIRDGGIADPSLAGYVYNDEGGAGFTDRLQQLIDGMSAAQQTATAAGLATSASVKDLAASSAGWLQGQRQTAATNATYAGTLLQRSQDSLAKQSGVNVDDEMTQLLDLERTYQASSKLIATVDDMFASLMQAIG